MGQLRPLGNLSSPWDSTHQLWDTWLFTNKSTNAPLYQLSSKDVVTWPDHHGLSLGASRAWVKSHHQPNWGSLPHGHQQSKKMEQRQLRGQLRPEARRSFLASRIYRTSPDNSSKKQWYEGGKWFCQKTKIRGWNTSSFLKESFL